MAKPKSQSKRAHSAVLSFNLGALCRARAPQDMRACQVNRRSTDAEIPHTRLNAFKLFFPVFIVNPFTLYCLPPLFPIPPILHKQNPLPPTPTPAVWIDCRE